jgi:hypothetical protein
MRSTSGAEGFFLGDEGAHDIFVRVSDPALHPAGAARSTPGARCRDHGRKQPTKPYFLAPRTGFPLQTERDCTAPLVRRGFCPPANAHCGASVVTARAPSPTEWRIPMKLTDTQQEPVLHWRSRHLGLSSRSFPIWSLASIRQCP